VLPRFCRCLNSVRNFLNMKLSYRLSEIAKHISYCANVADIGTDHGHLPVYLAQMNPNRHIIASDISEKSLKAAYKSASKYSVTESIEFVVAPGLEGISRSDVDTIVISGLGGETIVSILTDMPWTKSENIKLILQPQSKIAVLCRFLYDNFYTIKKAISVRDRDKTYNILVICKDR